MSFWADKKVVVGGGAGMVGSHLVPLLLDAGANVLVLDNLSRGSFFDPRATIFRVDVGEQRACESAFQGAFAVFNLAAHVAGVLYNQHNHAEMYERNMRLQIAPVLAAKAQNVPHFLQVSSVCVYAPEHQNPCLEENGTLGEPHAANNGYAWAKRMGERVVQWADLPHAVIVRPANLYGPRDYFDERAHVIPALIKKCLSDDEIIQVHGTGDEVREFLYAGDAARGMMAALEMNSAPNSVYNLGRSITGPEGISIRDLVALIQEATGTTEKPVVFNNGNGGDPVRSVFTGKAFVGLAWQADVSFADGLKQTVDWYRRTI